MLAVFDIDDTLMVIRKAVVTGGGGYFGARLGCALVQKEGYDVVLLLDVLPPTDPLPLGAAFIQADVRDAAHLTELFHGASVVFHCASYGMSGAAQLNRRLVEQINVGGTQAVVEACIKAGVERLVYTSTCNVVFGGQRIDNGDESLPLFPLDKHPDSYSRTKALAEKAVLAANMTPLPASSSGQQLEQQQQRRRSMRLSQQQQQQQQQGQRFLRTTAIRATGIWGPGEQRHLPRVAQYARQGLFRFTFGPADALADFVHVDNVVQAHLLAARGLSPSLAYVAAGEAYFVSDNRPINNFAFFYQLVAGLGYARRPPSLRLPLWLVFWAAFLLELLFRLVAPIWDFSKYFLLTRAEVYKAGQHHYFSIDKARRQLGYEPQEHSFQPVLAWFFQHTSHGTQQARQEWEQMRKPQHRQQAHGAADGERTPALGRAGKGQTHNSPRTRQLRGAAQGRL